MAAVNEILTQLVIPLIGAFVIGLVVGYMFFRAGRSAVSEYGPLFDGLAGHLLAQNGSSREALPRLRAAAEDARRLQRTDPTYRVHLAILEDRLAALTP